MPYLKDTGPRRGRPRDDAREAEILGHVMALITDVGYDGVSFEAVARRAGASKATLYRRWPDKRAMVVAAIKTDPASSDAPASIDTGSLRGDLLALLERLEASMRAGGAASWALLQAGLEDPDLCQHIESTVGPTGARLPAEVLRRAIDRDELPRDADPFAFEEVAGATLLIRTRNALATDRTYREHLVDAVLIPALQRGGRGSHRGIFSGAPALASNRRRSDA